MSVYSEQKKKRRFLGLETYPDDPFYHENFYGRSVEVEDIAYSISSGSSILIYGQSGIGKSSLINCGLLPKLRESGVFWPVRVEIKDRNNYGSVTGQIYRELLKDVENKNIVIEGEIQHKGVTVPEWFNNFKAYRTNELGEKVTNEELSIVLICDQFEDLYLNNGKETNKRSEGRFNEDLKVINSIVNPHVIDELYKKGFKYESNTSPALVISIVESYLGILEPILSVNESLRHNQHKIHGLNRKKASNVITKISSKEDSGFMSPAFTIPRSITDRILKYSESDSIGAISPFFLQLYGSWIEEKVVEGVAIVDDNFPNKKFANYLQTYYHDVLNNAPDSYKDNIAEICQHELITEEGNLKYSPSDNLQYKYPNEVKYLKGRRIVAENTIGSQGEKILKLVHSRLAGAIHDEANSEEAILTKVQKKKIKIEEENTKIIKKQKRLKKNYKILKVISFLSLGVILILFIISVIFLKIKQVELDSKRTELEQLSGDIKKSKIEIENIKKEKKKLESNYTDSKINNINTLFSMGESLLRVVDDQILKSNSHLALQIIRNNSSYNTLTAKCSDSNLNSKTCKKSDLLNKSVRRKQFYAESMQVINFIKEKTIDIKLSKNLKTNGYSYSFSKMYNKFSFTDYDRRNGSKLYQINVSDKVGSLYNSVGLKKNDVSGYNDTSTILISGFDRSYCKSNKSNTYFKVTNTKKFRQFKNQALSLPKKINTANVKRKQYGNRDILVWSYYGKVCAYEYNTKYINVISYPKKLSTILHVDIIGVKDGFIKMVVSDINRSLAVLQTRLFNGLPTTVTKPVSELNDQSAHASLFKKDEHDAVSLSNDDKGRRNRNYTSSDNSSVRNKTNVVKSDNRIHDIELDFLPKSLSTYQRNNIDWVIVSSGKEIQLRPLPRFNALIRLTSPSNIHATLVKDNKLYGLSLQDKKIYTWDLDKDINLPRMVDTKHDKLRTAIINNSLTTAVVAGDGDVLCLIPLHSSDSPKCQKFKSLNRNKSRIERLNFLGRNKIGFAGLVKNSRSLLGSVNLYNGKLSNKVNFYQFKERSEGYANSISKSRNGHRLATTFKPSIIIGNGNKNETIGFKSDHYVVAYQTDTPDQFIIAARYTNTNTKIRSGCVWYGKLTDISTEHSLCDANYYREHNDVGKILFQAADTITWMSADNSRSRFSVTDNAGTITWLTLGNNKENILNISKKIPNVWKSIIVEADGFDSIIVAIDPFGRIQYFSPPDINNRRFDLLAVQQIPVSYSSSVLVYDFDIKCSDEGKCTMVVPLGLRKDKPQVYIYDFDLMRS